MSNKTFCPFMTIGFAPPEEGKRDNRVCMKDCAWYNLVEEDCAVNVIASHLETIEMLTNDMQDYLADGTTGDSYYEDYRGDEDPWANGYRHNKYT